MTLLVLPGPEQSSSALHQSNSSLVSTCGRLHAEALRAHSVAEAALSQLQAEAEANSSRCLRDAEACETGTAVCNAERVEWQRSAAEGAALLSACEAASASSAATCEAAGKEACERESERERERADAEVVAAVSECAAAAASCQAEAALCQAERQAERPDATRPCSSADSALTAKVSTLFDSLASRARTARRRCCVLCAGCVPS